MFRRFLLGSVASNLRRVVAELVGKFASNFEEETYKVDNQASTFTDSITHSATTNATMTSGYGPELITNGTFDSASDWTLGAGWSITGGAAYYSSGGGGGDIRQNVPMVNGKTYLISLDVVSLSGSAIASIRLNAVVLESNITQSGTYEYVYTKTASEAGDVIVKPNNLTECTIDNISVREMPAIKWRPHNLLTYSEDLTTWLLIANTSAGDTVPTLTPNYAQAPDGTNTAARLQCAIGTGYSLLRQSIPGSVGPIPQIRTWAVWLKSNTGSNQTITIRYVDTTDGVVTVTPTWQLFEITTDGTTNSHECDVGLRASATDSTCDVLVWHPHSYRADLGGMVNNPDQEAGYETYVPTTSSPVYLPRRGHHIYNGYEWVNEGMLHESEARTNLFSDSNNLSPTNLIETLNAAISPTGEQTAVLLSNTDSGTNTFHYYQQGISLVASNQYTLSCYVKYNSGSGWVWLLGEVLSDRFCYFNIQTGVIGTTTDFDTATIEDVGNGWYRISATFTKGSADAPEQVGIGLTIADNTRTFDNTGIANQEQVFVYGFQLEEAPTPSSYIPTSGSTVTRAAESLIIPAANLPWPTPNVIGSELVTNGGFDDATGWTLGGGWTISSGTLNWSGGYNRAAYPVGTGAFEAGKAYLITGTVSGYTSGRVNAYLALSGNPNAAAAGLPNANGDFSIILVPTATVNEVGFIGNDVSGARSIDNISVKEIDPLSVSIQMNGRMTYADTNDLGEVTFVNWVVGTTYIRQLLRTDSTKVGLPYIQQNDGAGLAVINAAPDPYLPGVFVPFNIASRHTSVSMSAGIDGVAYPTFNGTITSLPDLSTIDLSLGYHFMGTIENFQIFDRDVGDDGLVTLTKPSEVPSLFITFDGSNDSYTVLDWSE